jgi:hypothetical protein
MAVANDIIRRNEFTAFLTCRTNLVVFYQKCPGAELKLTLVARLYYFSKSETIMTLAD